MESFRPWRGGYLAKADSTERKFFAGLASDVAFMLGHPLDRMLQDTRREPDESDPLAAYEAEFAGIDGEGGQEDAWDECAAEVNSQPTAATIETRTRTFMKELWDGLVVTWQNPFARNIVVIFGIWNLFGWMPESILVVYVIEALEGGGDTYGLLLAITSVGALVGGLALLVAPDTVSVRWATVLALGVYALTLAVPGIWPSFWVAAVAFFVQGLPLVLLSGALSAQIQLTINRRFLGRVYAVIGTVGSLGTTVGLALGGVVADLTSTPFVFVLGGVGIGFAALMSGLTFSSTTASIKDD